MNQQTKVKLMTPIFINGNYNREGKRIRARLVKTLRYEGKKYPLWISTGKNENEYPHAENDTHYLMIYAGGYLVPCGYTEYQLEQRCGFAVVNREMYGSKEARDKVYADIRKGKDYSEADHQIKEQISKENEFIKARGIDESLQAEYLKTHFIDPMIENYLEARDQNGRYASFQGAAFLGEVDKCLEISRRIRAEREKEAEALRAEQEAEERRKAQEKEKAEQEEIKMAEKAFVNGGTVGDSKVLIKLADKYSVDIPLRTRGWIVNSLIECIVSECGVIQYRFRRKKGNRGSGRISEILIKLQTTIQNVQTANTGRKL